MILVGVREAPTTKWKVGVRVGVRLGVCVGSGVHVGVKVGGMRAAVCVWAAPAVATTIVSTMPGTGVGSPEERGNIIDTSQPLTMIESMPMRSANRPSILICASLRDGPAGAALAPRYLPE